MSEDEKLYFKDELKEDTTFFDFLRWFNSYEPRVRKRRDRESSIEKAWRESSNNIWDKRE